MNGGIYRDVKLVIPGPAKQEGRLSKSRHAQSLCGMTIPSTRTRQDLDVSVRSMHADSLPISDQLRGMLHPLDGPGGNGQTNQRARRQIIAPVRTGDALAIRREHPGRPERLIRAARALAQANELVIALAPLPLTLPPNDAGVSTDAQSTTTSRSPVPR